MTKSRDKEKISVLSARVARLQADIAELQTELYAAKRKKDYILPSGFYLEQAPSGALILHVPAEVGYFPITLPESPDAAFNTVRRIFQNQKLAAGSPKIIGSPAVPTERMVKEWEKNGGKVTSLRTIRVEDFNP